MKSTPIEIELWGIEKGNNLCSWGFRISISTPTTTVELKNKSWSTYCNKSTALDESGVEEYQTGTKIIRSVKFFVFW
jgi:hypothetical protein